MKQLIVFLLLSITLFFVFVCCEDKSTNPPPPENPRYYYPLQKDYSWRYFHEGQGVIPDTFDLTIVGTNVRHGDLGFDRVRAEGDTNFIYGADTLFVENVPHNVPRLKILAGPIKAGIFWKDQNFDYLIQGFEACTLTINGEIYKNCAKIMKKNRNPTKPNKVYEWWAPQYGEVREIEVDTLGVYQYIKELLYFSKTGELP